MARTFALLDTLGRVLVAFTLLTVAFVPVARAQSNQATSIQLPDGSLCQFAGTGVTVAFNGQRVNYTCGTASDGSTTVILGMPTVSGTTLTLQKGQMVHTNNDFSLSSLTTLAMNIVRVQLVDGTTCSSTGTGATVTVNGQRLNFTCSSPSDGLLGDFTTSDPLWTVSRVQLTGSSANLSVGSSATVGIRTAIGDAQAAPTPAPAQATAIKLPDGNVCQYAGTGATATFAGQRVTYTCGATVTNGTTVILGNPVVQNGVWTVTEAVIEPGSNGPQLHSSQTVTMTLSEVQLVDSTQCTPTTGTVPIVENQRLNYTCGRAQEGLLGDFNTTSPLWTTVKVVVAPQPDGSNTVQQRQTVGISQVVGSTTTPSAQATSILLPDGSVCQFAGTGATATSNGQRVNYTCGTAADGSTTVVLGNPTVKGDALVIQRGVMVQGASGPTLHSSDTVTLTISQVLLVDGTSCASAGQGATVVVQGQRLNYTCGSPSDGLLGDFDTTKPLWTTLHAVLTGTPAAFTIASQETIGLATVTGQSAPGPTPQPTPQPQQPPQPAPPQTRDGRYFTETNFRVGNDAFWNFFQSRGAATTFGYPVSRQFGFLGCQVQIFQRSIMQQCGSNGGVALLNLLDPELFPYTVVNGSTFPPADDSIKAATPIPGSPNYDQAIVDFVAQKAPDQWNGQPVNFNQTFTSTGGLEIWGAPISNPAYDPSNHDFVYQRFQRGIMHYTAGQGTRGILLADYLKAIMLGPTLAVQKGSNLPADLSSEAKGSAQYAQYCPGQTGWLCRPNDLPGSDLTNAFEAG